MRSPKVYVSILNWNGLKDTIECLESLFLMNYANYHVIVVDNNSSDNSVTELKARFNNITLIENKINSGFTGGNNIAIEYAIRNGADYVWLLNNDTTVDSDCLTDIVKLGESSSQIGMVSPVIYYHEDRNKKQFSGSLVKWDNLDIEYPDLSNENEVDLKYLSSANVCLWGTALLIKAELISKIGVLKAEYFAYWEDTEYSLRSIKAGYKNIICTKSSIYHKTPLNKIRESEYYHYFMTRNYLLMLEEYLPVNNKLKFYRTELASIIITVGNLCRVNAIKFADAKLDGYLHAAKHISGPMNRTSGKLLNKIILYIANICPYFISNLLKGNFGKMFHQIRDKLF